jgi:hypothetical protein
MSLALWCYRGLLIVPQWKDEDTRKANYHSQLPFTLLKMFTDGLTDFFAHRELHQTVLDCC